MKTRNAILLTVGILAACGVVTAITQIDIALPMVVGTSVWAGIDSGRIQLRRYKSGISYGPVVLGVLCSGLWIVAFAWYLSMRHKIMTGTARLRPEFEPWEMSSGEMSPKGLVQPWQGRKL